MDTLKNEGSERKEPDLKTYAKWLDEAQKVFSPSGGNHVMCMTELFPGIAIPQYAYKKFILAVEEGIRAHAEQDKSIVKNSVSVSIMEGKLCIVRHTGGGIKMGMRYIDEEEVYQFFADELGKMFDVAITGLPRIDSKREDQTLTEEEKAQVIQDLGLTFRSKLAELFVPYARSANKEKQRKIDSEIYKRRKAKELRESTKNFQLVLDKIMESVPDLEHKMKELFDPIYQKTERIEKPKEQITLRSYDFINVPKRVESRVMLNFYECKITWDTKTGKAVLRLTTQNKDNATIYVHVAPGQKVANIDGLSGISIECDAQGTLLLKNEGGLLLSHDSRLVGCKAQYRKSQE